MIQVGITGDWLLNGQIEVSTCKETGCPDWRTLTIYRDGEEVLTVALSPDQDRELGNRLTTRADSVTNGTQERTPQRGRKGRAATVRRPLTRPPRAAM